MPLEMQDLERQLDSALELLDRWAEGAQSIVRAVEEERATSSLVELHARCAQLQSEYCSLEVDTTRLEPDAGKRLGDALREVTRWNALAREAVASASEEVGAQTRQTTDLRRRLNFYTPTEEGRSCDIAG